MKKRQGCLLQRMMAVLLSAVLVVGMVSNVAPMTVLAEEGSNSQENVNGNPAETKEGEDGSGEFEGGNGGSEDGNGETGNEDGGSEDGNGETGNEDGGSEDGNGETGNEDGGSEGGNGETGNEGGGSEGGNGETGNEDGEDEDESQEPGSVSGNDAELTAAENTIMTLAEGTVGTHSHDGVSSFIPWTHSDDLPTGAGNYYLTNDIDIVLQEDDYTGWKAPEGGITNLCLNGYKVTFSTGGIGCYAIKVDSDTTLKIYDCNSSKGTHTLTSPVTDETVTIQGGLITGNREEGSGILISAGGECNLYGGSIAGFNGGAVQMQGKFYMYEGAITHNSSHRGGGVIMEDIWNDGKNAYFYLGGGSISCNYADNDHGGGVYISKAGRFEMMGGEIKGNKAESGGGGIYCCVGDGLSCRVYLTGGVITENTTGGEAGGAVRFDANPGQQFVVRGNINIMGNKNKDGKESNLYLNDGYTIRVDSSGLGSGAMIGVTTASAPTEQSPIAVTGSNKDDYSEYFQSDNPAYEIRNDSGVVKLFVPDKTAAEIINDAKKVIEAALKNVIAGNLTTEDDVRSAIEDALKEAGINGDVTVTIEDFEKTEATTESTGSLRGTVAIVCSWDGTVTDSVELNKTIPKLTAGKYTVTVNSGTGGGEYAEGETVTITANSPASGKQFDKWEVSSGSVTLANAANATTTFTMPAGAVTVTATYKNKTGGGNTGGGSGSGNDNSGSGNADGGNDGSQGGSSDGGSGGAGDNAGGETSGSSSGTGTTVPKPGSSGTGQPRVKQEKEGNIWKEVSVTGESTLDAAVETPLSKLADIVLTKEEKQQAAAGTDIKIVLDVKDASAVVSAADRKVVETAVGGAVAKGYTIGQYLDISLYKVVGNSRSVIPKTNGRITVTIDVPDSLKNTNQTITRIFAVIRVHDGKAKLLTDLDNHEDTITIETDRFSTYAIVYKDTAGSGNSGNGGAVRVSVKNGGNKNPGSGTDNEPKTGDATPVELCATLSMIAGLTYLLLYFADRRHGMTEETKKEIVSTIIGWAKRGGKLRTYLALAAIFILLVYYHSIGKKTETVQTGALHLLQNP